MKKVVIILFIAFCVNIVNAQVESVVYFKDKKLEKISTKWVVFDKNQPDKSYIANNNVLTIKFIENDEINLAKLVHQYKVKKIRKASTGYIDIQIPNKYDLVELAKIIDDIDYIENVDINTIGEYDNFIPNDTDYDLQWHLPKIKMPETWDLLHGGSCAIVAIIDSGTDWLHEDLGFGSDNFSNIWKNSGENDWTDNTDPTSGNGVDDDGNGFIDDWIGWDFANNDNNPRSTLNSHGTQVAGITSAKTHNETGVSGVAGGNNNQGVLLMPLLIGEASPDGSLVDDAILYAVDNGADVIQMSLSVAQTAAIDAAIQVAENANIIVICASGNNSSSVNYPASNEDVIAVGSTNENDKKSSFSNYGSNLFISAPGENIYSTKLNNDYDDADGTSFSAPQVSGVVSLLKIINPNMSNSEVRTILQNSADKVGGYSYINGRSVELGYGRLNAYKALQLALPTISGSNTVCTSNKTFTLSDRVLGTTVNWTKSTNLSYVSGQGTNNYTVKAASSSISSPGWVEVEISGISCDPVSIKKDLWVGKPDFTLIGDYDLSVREMGIAEITNPYHDLQGISNTTWNCSGAITRIDGGPVIAKYWAGSSSGSGTVDLTLTNQCGSRFKYFIVNVTGGWLKSYPNPANDYLEIEITDEEFYTTKNKSVSIRLYNNKSTLVYSNVSYDKILRINTNNFLKGLYLLQVKHNDKTFNQQILIEH
jgi:hypothetical protein